MPCIRVGEEHVKLNHEQVSAWSKAINKGKATMEKPPARLQFRIEQLGKEQANAREAKNASGKKKKKKQRRNRSNEDSSSSSTHKRGRRYRSRSRDRPIIVQMPAPYYPPPVVATPSAAPLAAAVPAPHSSPIRPVAHAIPLMEAYIEWLKEEKPDKGQKYDEALRVMLKEDIELPHLLAESKGVTRTQLQGLGLTMGIAIDVKEGARTFRLLHKTLFNDSLEIGDHSYIGSASAV
jgi:hypothetical protein